MIRGRLSRSGFSSASRIARQCGGQIGGLKPRRDTAIQRRGCECATPARMVGWRRPGKLNFSCANPKKTKVSRMKNSRCVRPALLAPCIYLRRWKLASAREWMDGKKARSVGPIRRRRMHTAGGNGRDSRNSAPD